jgi:non-specific protein-tyrosine kinase
MSRVAEALRKARQGTIGDERRSIDTNAPEATGRDIAAVPVPWDVEPAVVSTTPRAFHVHHGVDPSAHSGHEAPGDPSVEFVELVQRLFRPAHGDPGARSVTFAAVGAARPDRSVALEVARTLARQGGGSVCLVDASLGSARLHAHASLPIGLGISDGLLAGRTVESLALVVEENLWMVSSGQPTDVWPARLPEALAAALTQLASRFDFLVIEGGGLDREFGMPTLMTVAPLTDGVVLVLEAERTRRDVAADVAARLRATGVTLLGAVLTGSQRRHG